MTRLSDLAVERLATLPDLPTLEGTKYQLKEELGRGGMGTVYRAHDHELGRDIALKVVHEAPEPLDIAIPDAASRLAREARALARLEHPGIVPVHEAGILPDGRIYYAMKLVRGARLDHFARGATLGDLLRLFVRICDTVEFAHANGVIHRDLKPQNVMVGEFGEVLVMDWGIAKVEGSHDAITENGLILGTPGYMPPEQASGDVSRIDARTDVFALGAILRGLVEAGGGGAVRPLRSVIDCATADDPSDRYQSARTLAADVEAHLDGLPLVAHREGWGERAWRVASRHRTAIALVLAYLAMRIVLVLAGRP